VFFDSLLRHWHGEAVGVLLQGLGRDGLAGLKGMRDRGLYTVAQDERRSVWGTPHAAAIDAAVDLVPISRVATRVLKSIGVLGESAAG
jgi:two-component system response regulator WspF